MNEIKKINKRIIPKISYPVINVTMPQIKQNEHKAIIAKNIIIYITINYKKIQKIKSKVYEIIVPNVS